MMQKPSVRPQNKKKHKDVNTYTIQEHLKELKRRIFIIVFTLLIVFIACLWKSNRILDIFLKQGREAGYVMIALSPQEALLQQLRVSFTCALLISFPILVYEVTIFVIPAVKKEYVKKIWASIAVGIILFVLGMCFTIFLLFPFILKYMKDITDMSGIYMQISVENYISFYLLLTILIGLIFEIPMICLFFSNTELITSKGMAKHRKIIIVIILIVAAIITPPDVVSQIMVAIPMIILYELSILLCRFTEKRKTDYRTGERLVNENRVN